MKYVCILCSLAAILWFMMFSPWTRDSINFWVLMMISTGVLAGAGSWAGRDGPGKIWEFKTGYVFVALVGSFLLYVIFWEANLLFRQLLPFAGSQVDSIYKPRGNCNLLEIGLMLLLWIGPAEEIFWRGFVQRRLGEVFGGRWGYIWAVVVYSFVHVWGFNLMLLGAAMVGGVVWGAMYYRFKSIWPGVICHAVWDVAIFVIWPIYVD